MNSKRPVKTSMFTFRENLTLVLYISTRNKNVLFLLTMHFTDDINEVTPKPEIITDCNKIMGGVDVVDLLCDSYNCTRATCRWYMVIFYSTMNVAD